MLTHSNNEQPKYRIRFFTRILKFRIFFHIFPYINHLILITVLELENYICRNVLHLSARSCMAMWVDLQW